MPNVYVFRPADAVETAEAWEVALAAAKTPSVLCLSRQDLPTLRTEHGDENMTARGAYLLRDPGEHRDLTIIATGSEVAIAVEAADELSADGLAVAVVSAPCWELFAAQEAGYRAAVLGEGPRVGVEAGVALGWAEWLGPNSIFIGMTGFGASGPAADLYNHFGITAERVAAEGWRLARKPGEEHE